MKKLFNLNDRTIFCFTRGIFLGLMIITFHFSFGQSLTPVVYSSAGGYYTSSNVSLSLTIGEPVIETYVTPNNILTTGFQQPEGLSPFLKTLNIVAFIEAAYNGAGGMNKFQDCTDGESTFDKFPGTVVDTVSVLLASDTEPWPYVYEAHAVDINTDGSISISGIPGSLGSNYYIVVKHRQSVETWSGSPVSFASTPVTYNFTSAASQAYGNNMRQIDPVEDLYSLWGGDISSVSGEQDGYVDIFDNVADFNASQSGLYGYVVEDLTTDGFVDIFDMVTIFNNSQSGIGMNTPPNPMKKHGTSGTLEVR